MAIEITSSSGALTPAQVHSWPKPTPKTDISGDPVATPDNEDGRVEALLGLARQRFKQCVDFESASRAEALTDFLFYEGMQWEDNIRNARSPKGSPRPCLTINRMPGFVNHVVNNMRQSRPAIKVDPVGDGADEDEAQIRQGLLRHIEVNSQADIAYDTSFKHMCIGGIGWMRVLYDWAGPKSMDQELFIRWVSNPFSVYRDPSAAQPDWSDMKFAFVVEDLTMMEFRAQFGPDIDPGSLAQFQSLGDQTYDNWYPGGKIRIAEYFHVEQKKDMLYELRDGSVVLLSELEEPPGDADIKQERTCYVPEVHWDLINATNRLKHRIWKGPDIPLIPVIGDVTETNGQQMISGMIRNAREPQRSYNYAYSCFMETLALAPRSQFIAEVGQIEEFKDSWLTAHVAPQVTLVYRHITDEANNLVPPPQRQSASPDLTAFMQCLQMCDQQMKAVFSIFDASLGQKGPQESGLAINARKIESDTGVYNWGDNFIRSLRRLGIVLNGLLKYYYNTPGKIMQILQDDDSRSEVTLNQPHTDPRTGRPKIYDLSKGTYSVVVSTGPTAQTKREASAQGMIDFFKMYPQGLQACAHILVGEMDFPGKDKLKAQLEKILPPNLQEPDPDTPPRSQQDQQIMDQMNNMIQQMTPALHALSDKALIQERKEQWETLRDDMSNQVKLAVADIAAKNDQAMYMNDMIQKQLDRVLMTLGADNVPTQPGTQPPGVALPAPPGPQGTPQAPGAPQGAPQPTLAAAPGTPAV